MDVSQIEAEPQTPPHDPQDRPPVKAGAVRIIVGLALSALSAVMLFVMWNGRGNLWPLVFVAFVPMYVAQYRLLPRRLSALALAIAALGYWLAMWSFSGLGPVVMLVGALIPASLWFVIGIFERPFSERTRYKWFLVQLPLLWVGTEVLGQANLLLGSNYLIAYRAAAAPPIIAPVSILSSPALSFLMIMINAGIALLVLKAMDRRWPQLATVTIPKNTVAWTSAIAGTVTVVWLASSLLIYVQVGAEMGPRVRVAAIQPGRQDGSPSLLSGATGAGLTPAENQARRDRQQVLLVSMTNDAARQGAQLIVWPEEILDYDPMAPGKGDWISGLAKATNATIVVGFRQDASLGQETPNIAITYLPNGQLAGQPYYKVHPVIAHGEAPRTPDQYPKYQTPYPTYLTPIGQLGVIICWDHDFPNSAARLEAVTGADIMAVPAEDPSAIVPLRWQSLVFRAVENRVPMVKADIYGDSTIVNANGDVVTRMQSQEGQTAVLVGDVDLGPRGALFSDIGGYPFAVIVIGGLIARYARQIYLWRHSRKGDSATPFGTLSA
ncbi:MAG: nitrilase-related carbon-nitrogen hydrolase [Actinomycetes bacterium]